MSMAGRLTISINDTLFMQHCKPFCSLESPLLDHLWQRTMFGFSFALFNSFSDCARTVFEYQTKFIVRLKPFQDIWATSLGQPFINLSFNRKIWILLGYADFDHAFVIKNKNSSRCARLNTFQYFKIAVPFCCYLRFRYGVRRRLLVTVPRKSQSRGRKWMAVFISDRDPKEAPGAKSRRKGYISDRKAGKANFGLQVVQFPEAMLRFSLIRTVKSFLK